MKNNPDVIVVGSGPLGIIAACRIAEGGRRVLVLEQGAAITQPPGSHLLIPTSTFSTAMQTTRDCRAPV